MTWNVVLEWSGVCLMVKSSAKCWLVMVCDAALAAKRNRYQRQKSLMVLEMESQHAKGLPSHFTTQ